MLRNTPFHCQGKCEPSIAKGYIRPTHASSSLLLISHISSQIFCCTTLHSKASFQYGPFNMASKPSGLVAIPPDIQRIADAINAISGKNNMMHDLPRRRTIHEHCPDLLEHHRLTVYAGHVLWSFAGDSRLFSPRLWAWLLFPGAANPVIGAGDYEHSYSDYGSQNSSVQRIAAASAQDMQANTAPVATTGTTANGIGSDSYSDMDIDHAEDENDAGTAGNAHGDAMDEDENHSVQSDDNEYEDRQNAEYASEKSEDSSEDEADHDSDDDYMDEDEEEVPIDGEQEAIAYMDEYDEEDPTYDEQEAIANATTPTKQPIVDYSDVLDYEILDDHEEILHRDAIQQGTTITPPKSTSKPSTIQAQVDLTTEDDTSGPWPTGDILTDPCDEHLARSCSVVTASCSSPTCNNVVCTACDAVQDSYLTDRQSNALRTSLLMPICYGCQVRATMRGEVQSDVCDCPPVHSRDIYCLHCLSDWATKLADAKEQWINQHYNGTIYWGRRLCSRLKCLCGKEITSEDKDNQRVCACCRKHVRKMFRVQQRGVVCVAGLEPFHRDG